MSGEEGGEKVPMISPVNKRLLGKTMQVAQRRGSFYHNLKKQQQELPPPINNQDSSSGKRVFRALRKIFFTVQANKQQYSTNFASKTLSKF